MSATVLTGWAGQLSLGQFAFVAIGAYLTAYYSQSLGFLVCVLLFWAWQHFELLRHGYRLEQMQRERAAETEINRHLRLEIDTLRSPIRIERLAVDRLHMVAPGPEEASVIERVLPAEPPPRSVVAQR